MKPDNSLNKPDPMVEELQSIAFDTNGRYFSEDTIKRLESYTTNKIIEARIELVEELLKKYSNSTEFKSAYNDLYLIKEHLLDLDKLKALNHRKDES